MTFASTIGLAFEAITRNKLRSALTSLGVIMGVAAVIVMMALGDGAKASIEQRVASLGTNILTVSAGLGQRRRRAHGSGRGHHADARRMPTRLPRK